MRGLFLTLILFVGIVECLEETIQSSEWSPGQMSQFKEKVKSMFYYAYDNYITKAYPFDELKPITGKGHNTYGGVSVTLIDALDTLAVLGNASEFSRVAKLIETNVHLNADINVSLFETNIRVLGGLLSGHLLYKQMGLELPTNWPCDGPLLRKATTLADKLIEAFDTPTGMPYGTLNLKRGVNPKETPVTCTACVGSYYVEFAALSRLTGNSVYEEIALRALDSLFKSRSKVDLVGNHINITDGAWVYTDSTIGAGVDSYFEYLLKGSILTGNNDLYEMFNVLFASVEKYMKRDDWHLWVSLNSGQPVLPYFTSLESFWPGLMTLYGKLDYAKRSFANYYSLWNYFGFLPEFMNIQKSEVLKDKEGYPLRPELIESAYYLFQATRDPFYLSVGRQFFESLDSSAKVDYGFAHVHRATDHSLEDQMESFFLAETIKYLYLLFDVDNFVNSEGSQPQHVELRDGTKCVINTAGYVFNTEAHPIDPSSLYCCHNAASDIDLIQIRTEEFEKSLFVSESFGKRKSSPAVRKPSVVLEPEEDLKSQVPFLSCHHPVSNFSHFQCPSDLNSYLIETTLGFDTLNSYSIDSSIQFCHDNCEFSKSFLYGQVMSDEVCYF